MRTFVAEFFYSVWLMREFIIADNQDISKAGMMFLLSKQKEVSLLLEADNKAELIQQLRLYPQAVIILDYTLFNFAGADELIVLQERFKEADWSVRMPSRFGSVKTDENGNILSWQEKPVLDEYINCGFFVFKREFLDYLSEDESCDLEKEPLERLAAEGQLSMYRHTGFWQCMDTLRDAQALNSLWDKGNAPWCK